jgi:hypothetical protein
MWKTVAEREISAHHENCSVIYQFYQHGRVEVFITSPNLTLKTELSVNSFYSTA